MASDDKPKTRVEREINIVGLSNEIADAKETLTTCL
jgi:hypothetical protein